jgi:hypothetical protein
MMRLAIGLAFVGSSLSQSLLMLGALPWRDARRRVSNIGSSNGRRSARLLSPTCFAIRLLPRPKGFGM